MTSGGRITANHTGTAFRPVVLKIGGELVETPESTSALGKTIGALRSGDPLIVVHGGGKDIDAALARAGIAKRQVDGLRITDDATLDIVVGVLAGLINTRLVAAVCAAGGIAVGLTGVDAGLIVADKSKPHAASNGTTVDLGRVGTPVKAGGRIQVLIDLCRLGYVPVVATIGLSRHGELLNVNADTFAASLALSAGARRLIIAGGTAGVLDEDGNTIPRLDAAAIDRLVATGTVTAGMIAKLSACREAVSDGVAEVVIADGHDLRVLSDLVRHGPDAAAVNYTQVVNCEAVRPKAQGPGLRAQGLKSQARAGAEAISLKS